MDALNDSDPAGTQSPGPSGTPNKKLHSNGHIIKASDEELKYRTNLYPDVDKITKDKVRCTACGTSLMKQLLKGIELFFHPLLQVLVCEDCRIFYGDGNFALDDDNSDTYCRWCAQGGSLYCCSACNYVFCKPCIRRNFKQSMLEEIEEVDWKCFVCNPDALWKHRAICWAARIYVKKHPNKGNDSDSGESSNQQLQRRKRLAAREKKWGKPSTSNEKTSKRVLRRGKSKLRSNHLASDDEGDSEKESCEDDSAKKHKVKERKREPIRERKKVAENEKPHRNKRSKVVEKEESEEEEISERPVLRKSEVKQNREENGSTTADTSREIHTESKREDLDDEDAKQILVMQNTCHDMEKLTKDTLTMTHSTSKKINQLHSWISSKNKISKELLPTTPAKLGKMIRCYKKILDSIYVHSKEFQRKLTECEEGWLKMVEGKKDVEGGDMAVGKEGVVAKQETVVNGEVNGVAESSEETQGGDGENNKEEDSIMETSFLEIGVEVDVNDTGKTDVESENAPLETTSQVLDCSNLDESVSSVKEGNGGDNEKEKVDEEEEDGKVDQDEGNDNDGPVSIPDSLALGEKLPIGEVDEDKGEESESKEEQKIKSSSRNGGRIHTDSDSESCNDSEITKLPESEGGELPVEGGESVDKEVTVEKQNQNESIQDLFKGVESVNANGEDEDTANIDLNANKGTPQPNIDFHGEGDGSKIVEEINSTISSVEDRGKDELVKNEKDDSLECHSTSEKIKPTKHDRDAKMAFLLDTSSSSGEEEIRTNLHKKKAKFFHESSMNSSDEGSDSSSKLKVVNSEKKLSVDATSVESLLLQSGDVKLKAGCFVPLQRLKANASEKLKSKNSGKDSEKDSISRAIDRLGDFSNLDKPRTKKAPIDADNDKKGTKSKEMQKEIKDAAKTDSSDEDDTAFDENKDSDGMEPSPKTDDKMNALAAKLLVESSLSDFSDSEAEEEPKRKKREDSSEKEEEEREEDKKKKKCMKMVESDDGDSSFDLRVQRPKKSWRNDKLLRGKLSETDSEEEEKRWRAKNEREKEASRKNFRRRLASSDSDVLEILSSDESDSSDFEVKKRRKRKPKSESSEENSSGSRNKRKQKRRRIKRVTSDSDESEEEKEEKKEEKKNGKGKEKVESQGKGKKSTHKDTKNRLAEETKAAAKNEEERRKRIADRQKLYNEIFTDNRALKTLDKLVLDFDPDTKKPLVSVHPGIVKLLKPHQVDGVKFMWDACCETLNMMKTGEGSGCILAHCMGLGKTLQVIALVHTLLSIPDTNIFTVLVICPLNTVLNWVSEFKIWLMDMDDESDITVHELSRYKKNVDRMYQLRYWRENGGVMVVGYNMYRTLIKRTTGKHSKFTETFRTTLLDPGPDLVICDEGHLLKNESSGVSKAVNSVKTARRIILTGTPLQNNLKEYHCMIQFVKPNLLGTTKEFVNRFVTPISNGQLAESTPYDVRVMKRRAHVLHKMLEGCVQRCDYSVLTPFLPPKHEYVICIPLTEIQSKLYLHYLEHLAQKVGGTALFNDFQNFQRIWTHPLLLKINAENEEKRKLMASDSEGSLKDFIDDASSGTTSSESDGAVQVKRKKLRSNCQSGASSDSSDIVCVNDENADNSNEWWKKYVKPEDLEKVEHSGKLVLLFDILQKCELIGDKILVFSQSLYSLDIIEYYLGIINEKTEKASRKILNDSQSSENEPSFVGSWRKGYDYFRIDGSVSGENRNQWCKTFNREDNLRSRLFLISTRAGGMGINLVGANRVILFDASWNPSNDLQSIFRIYRFGQKKPCYVYRFLAQGTMEEKIYNRQVTKLSLALRVIDEHQIERHFNLDDLQELYKYEPQGKTKSSTPMLPKDRLLAELIQKYPDLIENYHEHDSLLENKTEEELTEEERKAAWDEFENEKDKQHAAPSIMGGADIFGGITPNMISDQQYANGLMQLRADILQKHPNATEEQVTLELSEAAQQISQYFNNQGSPQLQQFYNPMNQHFQNVGNVGLYPGIGEMLPQQAALLQAQYGMQNYYHTPLLSSQTTNNNQAMAQVGRDPPYYNNPGVSNTLVMQRRLQPIKANTLILPKTNPVTVGEPSPKLKIRSDLMPVASVNTEDNDIIIESETRRKT